MRTDINLFLVSSIDLVFVPVIELDLVLYAGRKSLGFSVSIKTDLVFVWMVEVDLISAQGSELVWCLCGDRQWHGFSIWIEILSGVSVMMFDQKYTRSLDR